MTQKSRGRSRRTRGTASRRTRRQNMKTMSPALPDTRHQQQKQVSTSGFSDAKRRSSHTENDGIPVVFVSDQKETLGADISKAQAHPKETVRTSRKRPRQMTAHRPCTRSQTAGGVTRLSSDDFCAGVAATEDTYAKYYPNRIACGHLTSPPQASNEDTVATTAKLETTGALIKRGRRKRRSVERAPSEDLPGAQLSKKRHISWVSHQTCASSALDSSGKLPWAETIRTHLSEPDEASQLSKAASQQQTLSSSRSSSPSNCSQQRRQSKCRTPSKRRSYPRPRARQVLPASIVGPQDHSMSVNSACDQTRPISHSCETFELATGRFNAEERDPPSEYERVGVAAGCSRVYPRKQLPQELTSETPFFFFSRDLPEPSAPRWDNCFSPHASCQMQFTDDSETRSPTSSVKWKKKVISALGTCIPETVIREAAAAPPVFDLPEGADSSVLCDQYLQICGRILSSRMPCLANSNVTVAAPSENDVISCAMRPLEQGEVLKNFQSFPHSKNAAGRPTAANSTAVFSGSSGPRGQPSLTVNAQYSQTGSLLTPAPQRACSVTGSPSNTAGRKLKLCRLLLQKYRSRLLSRPDGDRWRHLFILCEPKPKWRTANGCAS